MPVSTQFGAFFVPEDLEKAVRDFLAAWLPTYFSEIERQQGIEAGKIARPKFYGTSVEADHFPGEELPAIIVVSPGTVGEAERLDGGEWAAWYQTTVACLVQTPNEVATRALATYYAAAVRSAILQHGSLDGKVDGTWWLGEEYEGEPGSQRNRTRGAAMVHFRMKVRHIVDAQNGPTTVPDEIPGDWPLTQTVEVTVDSDDDPSS